jgi:hypothetical protein
MTEPDREGEEPGAGEGAAERPGLFARIKRYFKDATVAATSTHGGIAGGVGGRKSRRKKRES